MTEEKREELHLKYRPQTFDDLLGNDALKESVANVLENTRMFLFYGPRGCGKTTTARIMARMLGIAEMDINEIDAATNNGIDDVRALKEGVAFSPLGGKYKIYIIDECHRLTGNASDGFLKTLEEPPKHTYFAFCTTDIGKVSSTIKSRAKAYEVKPLNEKQASRLIGSISRDEGFSISPEVKAAIIEACEGIPREIIIAMDMVRSVKSDIDAISLIHAAVAHDTRELCQALLRGAPWSEVAPILKSLKDEPERIRQAVMGYMNAVLLGGKKNPMAAAILDTFLDNVTMYSGRPGLTALCYRCQTG